jgi:hypothetical protein
MSQISIRVCCNNPKVKILGFPNEPPALFCKECLKDKGLTYGAISKIDIPQEVN